MAELSDFVEFDKLYELNIGQTFLSGSQPTYHNFKYDFTPASIDKNQEAKVMIGERNDVVIQVPHVDGSAQKYTQFTGNKQPCSNKECVLIYDTKTNEFTLERLQTNFNLKKSRLEGASRAQIITPIRSITPTNGNESQNKKKSAASAADASKKQANASAAATTSATSSVTQPPKPTTANARLPAPYKEEPKTNAPKNEKLISDLNLSDVDDNESDGSDL